MSAAVALFQPVRADGRAAWRVLYDYIERSVLDGSLPVGAIVHHVRLRSLLDNPGDYTYYRAVQQAARHLRKTHNRQLRCVPRQGYQLVSGLAHVEDGLRYHDKARRAVRRGQEVIGTADRKEMSADERKYHDLTSIAIATLAHVTGMAVQKIVEHGKQIEHLSSSQMQDRARQRASEEEIEDIRAQLSTIKQKIGEE